MIRPEDVEFHAPDKNSFNWAETNFFIFSVPEARISGSVYLLCRPNAGVCISSIFIFQGLCEHSSQALFADAQVHLPCPEKLSDFALPNGHAISVTRAPVDYHVRYDALDDACRFDFRFRGLGEPFDVHDARQNPLAVVHGNRAEAAGFGQAWANGHFDLLGHMKGSLTLHGKTYEIDCVDGMDHSWGPRPEWDMTSVGWMMMTFGPDLAFQVICSIEIVDGETRYGAMRFGHVRIGEQIIALVSAEIEAESDNLLGMKRTVRVVDATGRRWEMEGEAIAAAPWYTCYPSFATYVSLYRWTMGDRVGHSHVTDVFGLTTLASAARTQLAAQEPVA